MEEELRAFGLTDKEIKVYLASLYLGSALVQDIAKRAGTYRTYTYEVLKSLKEKGLVSYVIKGGKQYFEVASPDKLYDILKEKESKIDRIMPQLKGLYSATAVKPKIELYEGKEGLKTILADTLKVKKELLVYCSVRKQLMLFSYYFPNFIKQRAKKKIFVKVLGEKSKEAKAIKKRDAKEYRELRYLPKGIEFPTATYIYGNKVAIMAFGDNPMGVIIDNKEIAMTQRFVFEAMWVKAEK
ncbi:MAG: helix-turn-helix domain-containing protein [Nanoarchaeota archaeon]|nr:helix-turn-helix domain-containing protein [Nanoarchaeota archaeon]